MKWCLLIVLAVLLCGCSKTPDTGDHPKAMILTDSAGRKWVAIREDDYLTPHYMLQLDETAPALIEQGKVK